MPVPLAASTSRGAASLHSNSAMGEHSSLASSSQTRLPSRSRMSPSDEQASTKASLRAWWSAFTKTRLPGRERKLNEHRVFGVPLRQSLKYASVAISMAGDDGHQYVWGYVPVIVAKMGLYLKENGKSPSPISPCRSTLISLTATEVEGVFRKAGSEKRMKELQETFDTPPRVSPLSPCSLLPAPCSLLHLCADNRRPRPRPTVRQVGRLDQVQCPRRGKRPPKVL